MKWFKKIRDFFKEEYVIFYYPDDNVYSIKHKSWYENDYLYLVYADFNSLELAQQRLEKHLTNIKKVKKTKPKIVYKIKA